MRRRRVLAAALFGLGFLPGALLPGPRAEGAERLDERAITQLANRWFEQRPRTAFERWDPAVRRALLEEADALGEVPEGSLEHVRDLLWKAARRRAPRLKEEAIETPYGKATWIQRGKGGRKRPLLLALHGGGEGAGSAGEAAGNWNLSGALAIYPQAVRLDGDAWNTVHGETFLLTLIELAKVVHEVDPDRVYVVGFSMGGTGAWHMAGRHPDLLAGAIPAHGVLMASPKSNVPTKEEVERLQHGLVPNVRNLALYAYTGLEDRNCMPGTFCHAHDRIEELRAGDEGGYAHVRFQAHTGLAHTFPPREPGRGLEWIAGQRRDAFPRTVVWEYAEDPFPLPKRDDRVGRPLKRWFYWLRCQRPSDGMLVRAHREGNEFDLAIAGATAEDFEILLHPGMIDVTKDVVVRVDGNEVWRGRPRPDLRTILESLDARMDRTLVFDRRIPLPADG